MLIYKCSLVILSYLTFTECLDILVVMPHIGKSHQLVFEPLFKELATRGHKVTLITRYPQKNPVPNWTDISIARREKNNTELYGFDELIKSRWVRYKSAMGLAYDGYFACTEGLTHPNYINILNEDRHFDIILIEMFNTPCFMGVAKKFKAPVIGLSSSIGMPWTNKYTGAPTNPSYIPSHFVGYKDRMSFFARLENTLGQIYSLVIYNLFMDTVGIDVAKAYNDLDLNENGDISKNISLILCNTHFTLNPKMPLSPNMIEIGGIHVENQPIKPLPVDIKKFIDESQHGVIYMSLGSTIQNDTLPEDKQQMFLNVFSKLPQRVIWKWEGEMKNKPPKIMTCKWAPQRDVLCHPNVQAFIYHAGILGIIESVDCAKPILMIPQAGDQFTNAASVEQNGGGLALEFWELTEDVLYEKLKELLSPKFKESAIALSKKYKDRPLSPMNTAIYWIEYVARHNGAPFLKLASVDLPLYQYYLLDVIAFLSLIVFINVYLFVFVVKFVLRKCKKSEKVKKS